MEESNSVSSDTTVKNKKKLNDYELKTKDSCETNREINIFGNTIKIPLAISSTILDGVSNGELKIEKGAQQFNTIMIVSCCSLIVDEQFSAKETDLIKWLEIYIFNDRTVTLDLVKRAEKLKFNAIVLTIECPPKYRKLIKSMLYENFRLLYKFNEEISGNNTSETLITIQNEWLFDLATDVTWDDLEWLRRQTRLPIIVNGIFTAEDARQAVYNGANAVMISSTDSRTTLEVLPEIVAKVGKQAYVFVNEDLRSGSDIFKALAVGANAVFICQPIVCGLYNNGSDGVKSELDKYDLELNAVMKLCGCSTAYEINRTHIEHTDQYRNASIGSKL